MTKARDVKAKEGFKPINNLVAKHATQKGGFHEETKTRRKDRRDSKANLKSEYFPEAA